MTNDVLTSINTRKTPQTQKAKAGQTKNSAGGYTFKITDQERLVRFLTLGTDGGTYYASAKELTKANAQVVIDMAEKDHSLLVKTIVEISTEGRAPKQNPAIFALAIAASVGTPDEKRAALDALPDVARIGTHLFLFVKYVQQFRGWGRGLRTAVGNWYLTKDVDSTAYQMVKYRNREGFTHRDVLRLSHPITNEQARKDLFDWVTKAEVGTEIPKIVKGFLKAQKEGADVPKLVRKYRLSWEMLPDAALSDTKVWDALLDNGMPQTALMRQLPRLTRLGMLPDTGGRTAEVVKQLQDPEKLKKARVHPINVLVAQRTYASGKSDKGSSTWNPSRKIVDALDAAFYAAFGAVTPSGKRTMLALDVSGSMTFSNIAGMPLTPRDASAALALVQMATEEDVVVVGFTSSATPNRSWGYSGGAAITPLNISPRQRLDDAIKTISNLPFGGTDCAKPMEYALANGLEIDTFVVYTDSETYGGSQHPYQALKAYRDKTGIPAKLIVVGMTANDCTIADPSDSGSMDVAGFDSATPNLINDFSRGI